MRDNTSDLNRREGSQLYLPWSEYEYMTIGEKLYAWDGRV